MGAPTTLVERMFKTASNRIEHIPSKEFQEFYSSREPFISEWLIARCEAGGAEEALGTKEHQDYQAYKHALNQAVDNGQVGSPEEVLNFTPPGMSLEYVDYLRNRWRKYTLEALACDDSEILIHQKEWASRY